MLLISNLFALILRIDNKLKYTPRDNYKTLHLKNDRGWGGGEKGVKLYVHSRSGNSGSIPKGCE